MAGKTLDIPFGYGNLVSVTPHGAGFILWFSDSGGIIRGLEMDAGGQFAQEIVIRRRTEGQMKRKKGSLPPIAPAPPPSAKK